MILNFTDEKYYIRACQTSEMSEEVSLLLKEDAFLILIKDLKPQQLDNLSDAFLKGGSDSVDFSELSEKDKKRLYRCAFELIGNKKTLGSETIKNGKTNTSSWLSHSLWEGRLCALIAEKMKLDPERAEVMGILHDYGRKEIHTIQHVIRGFELLSDMGYPKEGLSCLTHSFINGGRCASNETAEAGFYVSAEGEPCWKDSTEKDDITLFLEQYEYNDYDRILNMADLMAASFGILSPYDRIQDIASRRVIDPTNRGYFLAELIQLIAYLSDKMNFAICPESYAHMRFDESKNTDDMMRILKDISEDFYKCIMQKT